LDRQQEKNTNTQLNTDNKNKQIDIVCKDHLNQLGRNDRCVLNPSLPVLGENTAQFKK